MSVAAAPWVALAAQLLLAPLLLGLVGRTKAFFGGRSGPPLLQPYYDLAKLLRKGAVYSTTTTWVFRALGPGGLAALLAAALLVPAGRVPALLPFSGDFLLLAMLLAAQRFLLVAAALDTGSSFEGMGASREVQFSALAEPALLVSLAVVARAAGSLSLSAMFPALVGGAWQTAGSELALAAVALGVVVLAENARIPVDDPATHLELTMVHEVMVLDCSGPDYAMVLYGSALKLWLLGSLVVGILLPRGTGSPWVDLALFGASLALLAVAVGVVESVMARLRLLRVPQLLVGAGVLACLALVLRIG